MIQANTTSFLSYTDTLTNRPSNNKEGAPLSGTPSLSFLLFLSYYSRQTAVSIGYEVLSLNPLKKDKKSFI
ncbi:hypothetical protein, partial [Barnesiella intestinihominis]|uniref:hypothetical protein n=1 Tax=Barnesiella intestinihominis TaxID=487174 RepID=UPI003AAE3BD5